MSLLLWSGAQSWGCEQVSTAASHHAHSQVHTGVEARHCCGCCCCWLPAQSDDTAAAVLQLLLSHAGSSQDQLSLAAQLLPLSSNMLQLLGGTASGGMQLSVTARSWPRVRQVSAWLRKYGRLVASLELEAVVHCCRLDASKASTAVLDATNTTAAGAQQVIRPGCRSRWCTVGSVCMQLHLNLHC